MPFPIEIKENWHEDFIVNLAAQFRPQIYVELGLYQCDLFNAMIPFAATLIGVDVSAEAGSYMNPSEKVMFMNMQTDEFAEVLKNNPISIDMLFIDADHSKESVLKDFWNFFPFVNDHGLILLHDTHPKNIQYTDKGYCGDAYLVIEELRKHNDEFEFMTIPIHPGLTLIRKRKTQLAWQEKKDVHSNNKSQNLEIEKAQIGMNDIILQGNKYYRIVCIAQIYNELRKQNLERFWNYINPVCDALVVYDDGSTDGSYEFMLDKAVYTLRAGENDFKNEVSHKKVLLEFALKLQPDFILWMDADEVLTSNARNELQNLCKYASDNEIDGISFHEINLWRSNSWKRVDNSYDLGWFVRLWRVTPDLMFNDTEPGLHQQQYPHSIKTIEKTDRVKVIHFGFASDRSLAFKYLVYRSHEQTGWALERLLDEKTLNLEKVDQTLFPTGLFLDDPKPTERNFKQALASLEDYKEEVFRPRISIVCLIYKSIDWLQFVYEQVLKYTDLQDKEFYFVANDANESVLRYLDKNYIPHYIWNNSPEQKKEWYINNVYRAWNFAAQKAKGDYLLFINSDMAFSNNWVENLFNKLNGKNCVASRLVESGKLLSGDHAISKNFGRLIEDYDEAAFNNYAKEVSIDDVKAGGLFMPLLIRKDDFLNIGGYPEGNIIPDTDIFNPKIAFQGTQCVSGDVVLMQKLAKSGISHTTSYNSIVYHFQCGEMDSNESIDKNSNEKVSTIISNDYLLGRMGEKTMWGFLLSELPNSVGVDIDSLKIDKDFEKVAKLFIKENYPESAVIVQNATFIDLIDRDRFTIVYLQDNLRAMGRKSFQQEANIKQANILVTNSKITASSYPEYNFEIIPIGVDDNLFRPVDKVKVKRQFNIPDGKVGIFVGDLSEVKGWKKVKSIIENHDEIFWIIVSKDNNEYNRANCKVFNRIDQEKLALLLNCADFFILGSPVETQCLAAIEACFCNLPVIMRNTGIFADFTDDEKKSIGYFGEDFEAGLTEVLSKQFSPREIMFAKKLTISGMVGKWKELITRGRLFAEQKIVQPASERIPYFTVIVPTYNQAEYLGEALDTLLAQSFTNWEAVIVNDGSSDNTKEVIDKYLSLDKRFRTFHKENGGVASALNLGIENARSEWICWLSSDDWYESDKLEHHYNAIVENPEIKFFISHWFIYLQQTGQRIKQGLWLDIPDKEFQVTRFFLANYVHGNSIAIHKTVFETVGKFDEALRQGQDFDMWLRIEAKYQVKYIDKRTCVTRIHPTQTTNSFVEGGVLDSTRSLFKFLNNHSFEELFPFLDFSNPKNVLLAINEIIYVSTKDNAFIYKAGFTTALIDKSLAWVNSLPLNFRTKLREKIKEIVEFYLANPMHPEVKNLLNKFLVKKIQTIDKHDYVQDGMRYIKELIDSGEQKKALAIETYFNKISSQKADDLIDYSKFTPIILGYPEDQIYKYIKPTDIKTWFIQPGKMYSNSVLHKLKIKCPECSSSVQINIEYEMIQLDSESKFICPSCKVGLKYNDKYLSKDLVEFNNAKNIKTDSGFKNKVAFFISSAEVIGGGSKVLFKYINWLTTLGVDVTLYSFSSKPDWAEISVKFIQLNENAKIDGSSFQLLFIFSIYDLPRLLNYVTLDKLVHICQGYEGYHYGTTYEEMRSDKHVLTQLHSVPVKNIVVSNHLLELFKTKFNREVEYVPNAVDHKIFYPNFNISVKEKSIGFIGNPKHLLKGFHFLSHAIRAIQNSKMRIDELKLYVVFGFELQEADDIKVKLENELGCKVELLMNQKSESIADLLRNIRVVACTSWYEGFSLPLLEGMACGTPVISTRNMGAESFCIDGFNSYLVDYGDANELINHLLKILYLGFEHNIILDNAFSTSLEYSEYSSAELFIKTVEKLIGSVPSKESIQKLLGRYKNFCREDFPEYTSTIVTEDIAKLLEFYIDKTNAYIRSNNYQNALKTIEQAISLLNSRELTTDYPDLLNLAGNLNLTLGNLEKAQEYFEKQLMKSPQSSSACMGLGDVLLSKDLKEAAKTMFEWAVKNDPENQTAVNSLAEINSLLGLEANHNTLFIEV